MSVDSVTSLRSSRSGPLKIIISSTPKTGNTWVKFLLAELYQLPMRDLPLNPGDLDWSGWGDRWIGHQHYLPTDRLLETAKRNEIIVITTLRHPADTFISLFHHIHRERPSAVAPREAAFLLRDHGRYGEHTLEFLKTGFREHLYLAYAWLRTGVPHAVRYEDLWTDPTHALSRLTAAIRPMPIARIRQAICACEIEQLRDKSDGSRDFFRKGGIGSWNHLLPQKFKQAFATCEPFPEQFKVMGYTMNSRDSANRFSTEPNRLLNPFRNRTRFETGVPVVPVIIQCYFDAPESTTRRWGETLGTGGGTYFEWLNLPSETDPFRYDTRPVISELAYYLYSIRPDIQGFFPEVFGRDRVRFVHWFRENAPLEYGLDRTFTASARAVKIPASRPGQHAQPTATAAFQR